MRGPFFDGDEDNYEMWEDRLLSYMKIHKLKDAINPDSTTIVSRDAAEESYAQLVHFLDKRSHSLVMRDGKNNGRKALTILREHYRGSDATPLCDSSLLDGRYSRRLDSELALGHRLLAPQQLNRVDRVME